MSDPDEPGETHQTGTQGSSCRRLDGTGKSPARRAADDPKVRQMFYPSARATPIPATAHIQGLCYPTIA